MKTLLVAVVATALAAAAVRADDKELILGRWDGETTVNKKTLKYGYEFQKDGVVMVSIPSTTPNPKGDTKAAYKWVDDATIEMTIGKTKLKYAVTVTKDELTLKDADKKTTQKLTRAAK